MMSHSANSLGVTGTAGRNAGMGEYVGHTKIEIAGQLKVLEKLCKLTLNPDGTRSVLIQHVLPTTIEYVEIINSIYPVDLVVSIVYSSNEDTVKKLREKGFNVLVPP